MGHFLHKRTISIVATAIPPKTKRSILSRILRTRDASEDLVGPIRGEVLGADRLAERARAIARQHTLLPSKKQRGSGPLLERLDDTRLVLRRVYERLNEGVERNLDISPAGEWLLDNAYIVQEHIREIRTSMPKGYYQELPKLAAGTLAGYPRVYELAIELIAHTEGHIDTDNITLFVGEYQKIASLGMGELWAVPTMLRLGLVENIRRMALRVAARLDEVESADTWAAKLRDASDRSPEDLTKALSSFIDGHPRLTPTFVARFLQQTRAYHTNFTPLVWLEQWLAEDGPSAEEAVTRSNRRIALTQVTVANSITSLRTIARIDWKDFVEEQSGTERILRTDPSGHYRQMSFGTRDQYRHIIEHIARKTELPEEEVARAAIHFAEQSAPGTHEAHVGYYLVDEGRKLVERETGYTPPIGEAIHRWALRHPNTVYFGGIAAGTLVLMTIVLSLGHALTPAMQLAVFLIALLPLNEMAVAAVNQLVTLLMPPRVLPKLELRDTGILKEYRTAVVVPTLFGNTKAVEEAIEHIEIQYLANRDDNLFFALLSDFTDAKEEHAQNDKEILDLARTRITELNARYSKNNRDVFFLFHRPRLWNAKQNVWMGWERKRGKLGQFNRFLRGEGSDAFNVIVGDTSMLEGVRYVITLDSDTVLPRDAAALMVGALAHPLNRAVYDESLGRVVRGYGILQPRVGVSLTSAHKSHFAAIHSGHPGVDPYTTAVSDVYQDLYGEGSFTGKGIYDVEAFERATLGRFPENTLLSHDLIEGTYTRAGLATDIELFDDYPTRYLTFTRRKHRWIRGDWQLIGWLRGRVPGPEGPTLNRLSAISRWKIFDNLWRSLIEISQLALLISGWFWLPRSPQFWTGLVLAAIAFPWIFGLLLAVLRPPRDQSWPAYYAAIWRDATTSLQQFTLAVTFLPHQAVVSADAIVRTLLRLFVTKRNLLEWQTASQVERSLGLGAQREVWRRMWPVIAVSLALLLGIVLKDAQMHAFPQSSRFGFVIATIPLLLLWFSSPALAHALSAPAIPGEVHLSGAERDSALRYAGLHWQYFEKFVSAETHWLAPDNFQEDPQPVVAMRTSPTNIGLQLLATVTAYDLGFINQAEMINRIENVFRSLERMRRFRGHFFNWYDLRDLHVLEPAYVSTVDSGNFAGHLIALKQACLELMRNPGCPPDEITRLNAIAERAHAYAMEMDFRFLFDERRKLFSIGYLASSNTFDNSFYDLLASEARLASFVAIAKDDVPVDHWFRLGRSLTASAGMRTLISWSGSMFEYLMPVLVMQSFPETLLAQTNRGSVKRQISYGTERGVPWGVSESAYNVRDRAQTYQYRGFGVPDLALKRGLSKDLVVAPYATALAMVVEPQQALRNFALLEEEGALGPYGFRDAIDYTRPDAGQRKAIVGAYMAHHIGMSIVALANALCKQSWQRRFHSDPLVRSTELVLQERIPRRLIVQDVSGDEELARVPNEREKPAAREIDTPTTPQPRVAVLGNVPYTLMITNAGGGYSKYGNIAINRWRLDGTRDNYGQWCYIRDVSTGRVWSAAHQPTLTEASWYRVLFASDRVTILRGDDDIETHTEIAVASDDAAEVRRVTVINRSSVAKEIELTSYSEVILGSADADRAHPAFGNLFVQTEWLPANAAILATRRPRSFNEQRMWCGHVVALGHEAVGEVSCETDRAKFVGRGRSVRHPIVMEDAGSLSGTVGSVLDPVLALRARVLVQPRGSAVVTFTTFVTDSRERAAELADLYHDSYSARRALDLSWAQAQAELRDLGITPADASLYQELAGHLFFPHPGFRTLRSGQPENKLDQQALWGHGISGDWPIVLGTISSASGLPSVRQLLRTHHYWRLKGITCDLVLLNMHPASYLQELNDELVATVMTSSEAGLLDRPGGVFIRRADVLKPEDITLLRDIARLEVDCDGLGLGNLTEFPDSEERYPPRITADSASQRSNGSRTLTLAGRPEHIAPVMVPSPNLMAFNGIGGFNDDLEYEIHLTGETLPPAPWSNVVGNPNAGFCVTESGAGFTWADNSYFYRLTPWHNDPVRDPSSDCIYIRDDATGELWSPTPAPIREESLYRVRHGAGYSVFDHQHGDIQSSLRIGLPENDSVKISVLTLTNSGATRKRLTITPYVEWVLGVQRDQTQHRVRTAFDRDSQAIFARNYFDAQFANNVAFLAMSTPLVGYTADRREFIGRNGTPSRPAALLRTGLAEIVGETIDPCAALQSSIELAPGETRQVVVLLGAGKGEDGARELIAKYNVSENAAAGIEANAAAWRQRLTTVQVETPSPDFDVLINGWLLYQALSCRMWARSALYQSSGAYGFRDQLQDVMAFLLTDVQLAREHILRAAARQFVEGDVQHWWHPQSGRGVRTRFSDDLAWLPFVVDHYIQVTGDTTILDESVPFLTMRELGPEEHEIYDLPGISTETATVYEHCVRALNRATTEGEHGLPKIGIGDWNDGMSRVGVHGRGESVWLGWFLYSTLRKFAVHSDSKNDSQSATKFRDQAERYRVAIEKSAWDGEWYRRAYFDDGSPLGSRESDEAKIDAIAQSWSVISGAGDPERARIAMESFNKYLVREDARLLVLLTPPFDKTAHDPGYIRGYLPGVRENGAQYTHAALWAVLATAMRGEGNRAFELFQMINPVTHGDSQDAVATYKVEPYVVAADVYTADGQLGRGGWTWYTGSASWMYRVGLESLLGFQKRADKLLIDPCIPKTWPGFSVTYRFGKSVYDIKVVNPNSVERGVASITVDGVDSTKGIALIDDGRTRSVTVTLGVGPQPQPDSSR
jgi:cyclic beta-1,2-glucan synthetase